MEKKIDLNSAELNDLKHLPETYLICYLNGFEEAKDQMEYARPILKKYNKKSYQTLKESLRILRKVKYN